jgi:hypothetical protein
MLVLTSTSLYRPVPARPAGDYSTSRDLRFSFSVRTVDWLYRSILTATSPYRPVPIVYLLNTQSS